MQPGQRVAHYEILGSVGRGGMGVVYRARDTKLDRIVALKFLPPEAAEDAQAKKRFMQEARASSSLDHPNICTIHDIAETEDGSLYIVMAYYEGRTLRERLQNESFTATRCAAVGKQLAAALSRAHDAGIIHRDLKPANVMVLDDGSVKLLDFGVAKLTSDKDRTATKGAAGTISYMSPEQLDDQDVDHRTDLWALGVVLYETLTGRHPFGGETTGATVTAITQKEPQPLCELRPDVPEALHNLIHRCLSKDREARPVDAASVQRELEELDHSGGSWDAPTSRAAPPVAPSAQPGRPRAWIALVAVAVGLVAIALWTLRPRPAVEESVDSDLLAVMPFTIRGSENLAYLGEGMVDLMSNRLDGLGTTRTVPPRVLFARMQEGGLDPVDPGGAASLASRLGAGRYVTGDLVEVGERITLSVYLHDTKNSDETPSRTTVEGLAAEVMALVDEAVANLATQSFSAPADRLQRIGAITSHSLEATRAYLDGERLLRAGRYREAYESYESALTLDPKFALAHYRKSVASDWIDAYDVRSASERALEFADSLPPRDRSLLEALIHRRNGRNRAAEQAYRAILHRYPDSVEAFLQLGEVYFHDNPRSGRRMLESAEPFERTIELEPSNANARIHLARLYALRGEHKRLDAIAQAYARVSAESERLLEVEAMRAFGVGDVEAQNRVVDQLQGKPAPYLFYAAHGVTRFARSAEGAHRILENGGSDEPLLLGVRAELFLEQGRFEAFDEFLDRIPNSDSACWQLYRAFVLTSGIMPPDEPRMTALLETVRSLTPQKILESSWLPPYEDMTELFATFERDYHVAMLAIHTGRLDEARRTISAMEQSAPLPGLGKLHEETLTALRAELLLRRGDEAGALEMLRTIDYEIPHAISVRSMADGTRSRFLRAELERTFGDPEAARGFYMGLDQSWSWWDTGYRPQVYWGLAKIAETQGRIADARLAYTRLLTLWKDTDEVNRERFEAARAALEALPDR